MQLTMSFGTFLAVALRNARKTLELRLPFGKRAPNLRRFENGGGASSPMREVSLAQPNKDFFSQQRLTLYITYIKQMSMTHCAIIATAYVFTSQVNEEGNMESASYE